jgi:hypothetical protein
MMHLFFSGPALLTISFVVHLIIWRVYMPKRPILALLGIFAGTPVLAISIFAVTRSSIELTGLPLSSALRVFLFYLSSSMVYICLYSAIEVQSPSLAIVSYIASCGSMGCSQAELVDSTAGKDRVMERIGLMETWGIISISQEQCRLTREGRLWAALFECASRIFALPLGG